jgi:dGTPase
VRALIDRQVTDLLANSRRLLKKHRVESVADVRSSPLLITPSAEVLALKRELEAFLHERVYRHYRVMRMATKGQRILEALFAEFCRHPEALPPRYFERIGQETVERVSCDYLAGMTDRYAQDEYLRLFQPYTPL